MEKNYIGNFIITGQVYEYYFRVSVSGSMPELTDLKIDKWTIAKSRPRGSHVECGTTVKYDYWLTMNEVVEKFAYEPPIIGQAWEQVYKANKFFDSLRGEYNDLYFRVLYDNDGWRDIDGVVKSDFRPSDKQCDWRDCRETYKTISEIITDYSELLPMAIYIHDTYKPEAVGDALPF